MTYHLIKMNSIFMYYLMTFDSDIMTYERKKTLSWRHIDINYLNEHKMYQIPYSLIICFLFFVFYPTTNVRPELVGNGIFVQGMRFLYQIDKPVNLFPSIHCMASWFCCIGIRRDKKIPVWYKIVSVMIAVLVFVSTLVTKQHVIVDVIGGVVVAELTWFVSCRTNGWKIYRNLVRKAGGENGK